MSQPVLPRGDWRGFRDGNDRPVEYRSKQFGVVVRQYGTSRKTLWYAYPKGVTNPVEFSTVLEAIIECENPRQT